MPTALAPEKRSKSLKAKKRELYREAVLDAAERVFGDEGYEATKVQRIAADAGLSLTTLYSVFESKWEIYRAVHRRRLDEVMRLAEGVVQQGASPLETLIAGTRMQLGFFMDRRDYTKMQLKEVTAWSTIELLRSPEQVEGLGPRTVRGAVPRGHRCRRLRRRRPRAHGPYGNRLPTSAPCHVDGRRLQGRA